MSVLGAPTVPNFFTPELFNLGITAADYMFFDWPRMLSNSA